MKIHQHLITVALLALSMLWTASCTSTRNSSGKTKVEGMVWFNPASREVLQFRKGYVLQTKWDSTALGLKKSVSRFAYTLDAATHVLTFNNTAYQIQQGDAIGWALKKAPNQNQPAAVFNPIPSMIQAERWLTGVSKQVLITGTITSEGSPQPIPATITFERLGAGPDEAARIEAQYDASQGTYSLTVPAGYKYRARVEAPNALGESRLVDLYSDLFIDSGFVSTWHEKPLRLVSLQKGATIRLLSVFFEFDKADLVPGTTGELESIAQWMNASPQAVIEIAGHTDNLGAKSYNQRLSEQRASTVKNFLTAKGIDPSRLRTIGYGESRPLTTNDPSTRPLNRRIELHILGE